MEEETGLNPDSLEDSTRGYSIEGQLSAEIWSEIFSYLHPEDLCCVALTCARWRALSEDNHIWGRFVGVAEKIDIKRQWIQFIKEQMRKYTLRGSLPWLKEEGYYGYPTAAYGDGTRLIFKALLQGRGCVGKTTLARVLEGEPFDINSRVTIGHEFTLIHDEDATCKKTVQLWDMGAVEPRSIPLYYRGLHILLIVYDVSNRESFDSLPNWLSSITQLNYFNRDTTRVYLVGNKFDLKEKKKDNNNKDSREVSFEEAKELCKKEGLDACIEVSAKTGHNLMGLKNLMMHEDEAGRTAGRFWLPGRQTFLSRGGIEDLEKKKKQKEKEQQQSPWGCMVA